MAVPRYPRPSTSRVILPIAPVAMAAGVPAAPVARAAAVPQGSMVVAWHTTIAPRWHDRQQHDRSATPDGLLTARQNILIKNHKTQTYHCTAVHGPL